MQIHVRTTFVALLLFGAVLTSAQEMTDLQRAAQRLSAHMAEDLEQEIVAKGYSEEEAKEIVAPAVVDYGMCLANSFLDQARSQGISERAILKELNGESLTPVEEMDANRFDRAAFLTRMEPCERSLASDLDVPKLGLYEKVDP